MSVAFIQLTEDGSPTLFSNHFQETYHSKHGALTESLHVFIRHGLEFAAPHKNTLRIGEIGLGSGLNAYLSYEAAVQLGISVSYFAIEAYPIDGEVIAKLSESSWCHKPEAYLAIMNGLETQISPQFSFSCSHGLWPSDNPFRNLDVLYYDAFAPACQPELWNLVSFQAAWDALAPGGILVTYCAKGEVKRTLKSIGFQIENMPGPPGKREMTRATRPMG